LTELRRGAALVRGEVVDDEELTGGRGVAWGGLNRRVVLRRTPAIDVSIGAFYCAMWVREGSRRIRRKSGASLVWKEKAEGASFYSGRGWPWQSGWSSRAPAILDAKGQDRGRVG
jgi:hypothetical protein